MRKIAVLGATGSIGTQTLDLIRKYKDVFNVVCLTAHSSYEKLFDLAREFKPDICALEVEPERIPEDLCDIEWFFGKSASAIALKASGADDVLNAIVGIAGLEATITAAKCCKRILLANKEALVTGGSIVMSLIKQNDRVILPVDSEHSAIFQCLQGANGNKADKLILTASGGALRDRKEVTNATVADVLDHPTWNMGSKITVDCATMLNKGLEIIEAHYLFDMPVESIEVVIHPQSIIHSMVEFADGAVIAQLGVPDMRVPIGYALGYPYRLPFGGKRLSFKDIGSLSFYEPDLKKYKCLALSIDAIKSGGNMPVVLNGANEAANKAFLEGKISFGMIADTVEYALNKTERGNVDSIEDVYRADSESRLTAEKYIDLHT